MSEDEKIVLGIKVIFWLTILMGFVLLARMIFNI
jgi:hypothetical protein